MYCFPEDGCHFIHRLPLRCCLFYVMEPHRPVLLVLTGLHLNSGGPRQHSIWTLPNHKMNGCGISFFVFFHLALDIFAFHRL